LAIHPSDLCDRDALGFSGQARQSVAEFLPLARGIDLDEVLSLLVGVRFPAMSGPDLLHCLGVFIGALQEFRDPGLRDGPGPRWFFLVRNCSQRNRGAVANEERQQQLDAAAGTITVTLPNAILFASGKASLKNATSGELDHILSVLREKYELLLGKQKFSADQF